MRVTTNFKVPYKLLTQIEKEAEEYMRGGTGTIAQWLYEEVRANWSSVKPSAPFNPPAIDSGAFDASIDYRQQRGAMGRFTSDYIVSFNTDKSPDGEQYAQALEFGTPTAAPRPYLAPALRSLENEFRGVKVTFV